MEEKKPAGPEDGIPAKDASAMAPKQTEQLPSLGRIVIYYAHINDGIEPRAALVCHVWSGNCVNLAVFDHNGTSFPVYSATKGGSGQPGTWDWPKKV